MVEHAAPPSSSPELRADVFDALPGQAAVLDETGAILAINDSWRSFARANGVERPDAVKGENYLTAAEGGSDGSETAAGIRAVLDGERDRYRREYPCHTANEKRWFLMRALPLQYSDRRYAVVMHTDITDRRLAEAEVMAHNEQLEVVASILSHDLRNPLTVALGRIELLDGEQAAVVEASLERMADIVDDALTLARLDAVEATTTVALAPVVEDAWSHVATDDATLAVDTEATIEADDGLLGHLFENCFRNAVEHGGPAVTVTVGSLADGFYVADDGAGIPPEGRDAVFEMGESGADDGTGIGLAIVERVARMHGWSVTVTESRDGGARFEVTGVALAS